MQPSISPKDPTFKGVAKTAPMKLRIPYLSNAERIEAGTILICKYENPRKRKR